MDWDGWLHVNMRGPSTEGGILEGRGFSLFLSLPLATWSVVGLYIDLASKIKVEIRRLQPE